MSILTRLATLAGATLVIASAGIAMADTSGVMQTIKQDDETGTFCYLVDWAGLNGKLSDASGITILVPTDAAWDTFKSQHPHLYEKAMHDRAVLDKILLYHVMKSPMKTSDFADRTDIDTMEGDPIHVDVGTSGTVLDHIARVGSGTMATNGVVHVINTVLIPPCYETNMADIYSRDWQY